MAGNFGLAFTTQAGAQWIATMVKAQNWNQECFIGRSTNRPNRFAYIMEYWKTPIKWTFGS